jgi:cbb3-type cytochrome oxidase subunit 3
VAFIVTILVLLFVIVYILRKKKRKDLVKEEGLDDGEDDVFLYEDEDGELFFEDELDYAGDYGEVQEGGDIVLYVNEIQVWRVRREGESGDGGRDISV